MPMPILCLDYGLCQYVTAFAAVFTPAQGQHLVTVLLGLVLAPERRTLSGLRGKVAGAGSLSALSRFVSGAPWGASELAEAWQARFRAQLAPRIRAEHARQRAARPRRRGRPAATRVIAFAIFDDSTIAKHAQGETAARMEGVGRHYSTTAKGLVAGHSLFAGLWFVLGRRCPLPPRLYRQRAVAEAEGAPFRSKVDLAVEAVAALVPLPGTQTHVLVDAWYTCRRLWRAATARGFAITGGLKANRWLRLADPNAPGKHRRVRLSAYVAGLAPTDFAEVEWRGKRVAAHLVRTFVYKLGACQVLVVKASADAPPSTARCWATSDLTGDVATVAAYAATRWEVETYIEDGKELLGLDHYQLTRADAIERFWHLVACAYLHLDERRDALRAAGDASATLGDALRAEQAAHQRHLLEWLQDQFRQGASIDDVQHRLAA
jgi:DDE superfamily endonuclease